MKTFFPLLLVIALALPAAASAQGPIRSECVSVGLKDCKALDAFTTALREAVKKGDKEAVAGMVTYPIEIQLKDGFEIKNKQEFVRRYDEIMLPELKDAIAQQPFVHPRKIIKYVGDNGQVWLDVTKGKLFIGTIIID